MDGKICKFWLKIFILLEFGFGKGVKCGKENLFLFFIIFEFKDIKLNEWFLILLNFLLIFLKVDIDNLEFICDIVLDGKLVIFFLDGI